jgi:hypothetical protein
LGSSPVVTSAPGSAAKAAKAKEWLKKARHKLEKAGGKGGVKSSIVDLGVMHSSGTSSPHRTLTQIHNFVLRTSYPKTGKESKYLEMEATALPWVTVMTLMVFFTKTTAFWQHCRRRSRPD